MTVSNVGFFSQWLPDFLADMPLACVGLLAMRSALSLSSNERDQSVFLTFGEQLVERANCCS